MITTIGEIVRGDREIFPPYLYEAYQSTIRRAPTMPLVDVPLTLSELTGPGPAITSAVITSVVEAIALKRSRASSEVSPCCWP